VCDVCVCVREMCIIETTLPGDGKSSQQAQIISRINGIMFKSRDQLPEELLLNHILRYDICLK
jgi:hypothetical protein